MYTILYEDNHILVVNKAKNILVQGDKTGDEPLVDILKNYLKEKYNKPGNVFLGVVHRIDRPVSGVVLFARTSKALERLNKMLQDKEIKKTYWALVKELPKEPKARIENFIKRVQEKNKSFVYNNEVPGSKKAVLSYRVLKSSENYHLLEIDIETGRHHQIRAQLAGIGCPIKGDLKYGFPRSNPDGGNSLHARSVQFVHPVTKEKLFVEAPVPEDNLWKYFK